MIWPFSWKKKETESPREVNIPEESPAVIKIDNTDYEDVIRDFLEMAGRIADDLRPGESFKMELPPEMQVAHDPMELIGPIMMRASWYDLSCDAYFAETFHFTKQPSPR